MQKAESVWCIQYEQVWTAIRAGGRTQTRIQVVLHRPIDDLARGQLPGEYWRRLVG